MFKIKTDRKDIRVENFDFIIDMCKAYGVVRIIRKKGSLKHYEQKFRRWLKWKDISHIFTISNRETQLYIWITAWFHSTRMTPQILGAVGDDNSIIDETMRPIQLVIEELDITLNKKEVMTKGRSLGELAHQQFKSGIITEDEYKDILSKIPEKERR